MRGATLFVAAIVCLSGAARAEVAAKAQPIASGEAAPYALAQDATHVYWASPAVVPGATPHVRRVAKTPGAAVEDVFPGTAVATRSLAFDGGGKLVWADTRSNRVMTGTPGETLAVPLVAPAQGAVQRLAVVGGKMLWSVWSQAQDGAADGCLWSMGAGSPPSVVLGQQSWPDWVTAAPNGVPYWIDSEAGEVRRLMPSPAGTSYLVVASGVWPLSVQVANDRAYWNDGALNQLRSVSTLNLLDERLELFGHGHVAGFTVDGTTLYVLTKSGGLYEVWRKAQFGQPVNLGWAEAVAAPYDGTEFGSLSVLVDANFVYFADAGGIDPFAPVPTSAGNGVVYRVPR